MKLISVSRSFVRTLSLLGISAILSWAAFASTVLASTTPQGNISPQNQSRPQGKSSQQRLVELRNELKRSLNFGEFVRQVQMVPDEFSSEPLLKLQILESIADATFQYRQVPSLSQSNELAAFSSSIVQTLIKQLDTNGKGPLETGYRSAAVLESYGNRLISSKRDAAALHLLAAGEIARNLYQNPAYPPQARGGLAPLLVAEARGHVLNGNDTLAMKAVQDALNWGIVEFDRILNDPLLAKSGMAPQMISATETRRAAYRNQVTPGIQNAMSTFQTFNFDFSLLDTEGARFTKSRFAGDILVVDLWGTWCGPCRAAIPHLNHLQKEFGSQGLKVVGIAMEQGETAAENRDTLKNFLSENEVNYQCLLGEENIIQQLPNFKSYPTMLFIDRTGKVRFATSGYVDYTQLQVISERLLKVRPISN